MILADYFKSEKDATWDFALQSGVKHGVIRLPEDEKFDITEKSQVYEMLQKIVVHRCNADFYKGIQLIRKKTDTVTQKLRGEFIKLIHRVIDFHTPACIYTCLFNTMTIFSL